MGCHRSSEECLPASILPHHIHIQTGKSFIKHFPKMAAGSPHNSPLSVAPPPSPQRSHRGWGLSTPHSTRDGACCCWGPFCVWGQEPFAAVNVEWRGMSSLHPLAAPAPQCGPCGPSQHPRREKGGDKTSGDDTISLGLFFQEPPPSNKPLGLPRGEQCRVGVRGGLQRGEQALGTPVFRRGRPQRRGGWRNGDKGENGCSALSALQARLGYVPTIWNKSSLSRGYFWHTLSSL